MQFVNVAQYSCGRLLQPVVAFFVLRLFVSSLFLVSSVLSIASGSSQPVPAAQLLCHDFACGGHGQCLSGWCECDAHWSGQVCEHFVGTVVDPLPYALSADGTETLLADGGPDGLEGCAKFNECNGHGECGVGFCRCDAGWSGADCATKAICHADCNSPSGRCLAGLCVCEQGFAGAFCGERVCPRGCWGHGTCDGHGRCSCYSGWGGTDCSERLQVGGALMQQLVNSSPLARLSLRSSHGLETGSETTTKTRTPPPSSLLEVGAVQAPSAAQRLDRATAAAMRRVSAAMGAADKAITAAKSLARAGTLEAQEAQAATVTKVSITSPSQHLAQLVAKSSSHAGAPAPAAATSGACIDDCSGHGSCVNDECQCGGGWSGESCDIQPCLNNCLGQGTCLLGSCVCKETFYGPACEYSRCLNDCSGRGSCNEAVCLCDQGFVGHSCEQVDSESAGIPPTEAPMKKLDVNFGKAISSVKDAGTPPVCPENCQGNGKCNEDGSCSCYTGYSGVACQDFCPNLCSGQGQCSDGICLCLAGFAGADCSISVCCSGHGDCTVPETCVCQPGWVGDMCQLPMPCPDPTCSSHGQCLSGQCMCDPGWGGSTCENSPSECGACPPGGDCDRATGRCMCGGVPCGDRAAASAAGQGGGGGGSSDPLPFSERNKGALQEVPGSKPPISTTTTAKPKDPDCNAPNGKWNSTLTECVCEHAWYGDRCTKKHCADWNETLGNPDCSAHGMCVLGNCFCSSGWGKKPEDSGPNTCKDVACPVDCGRHGRCDGGQCVCQDGWKGPACREPACPQDCAGHGQCSFVGADSPGQCVCEYGWELPACAAQGLYMTMPKCPNDCAGNGLCMNGKCVCTEGFFGADCSSRICREGKSGPNCEFPSCPRDCNAKGLCFNGQCSCDDGQLGPDCSIPAPCFDACRQVCLPDLAGERCEFCKGQCLTLIHNPVLGHHNPMVDRLNTLMQVTQRVDPSIGTFRGMRR